MQTTHILFYTPKGGEGYSTLAALLGSRAARSGVLMVAEKRRRPEFSISMDFSGHLVDLQCCCNEIAVDRFSSEVQSIAQ